MLLIIAWDEMTLIAHCSPNISTGSAALNLELHLDVDNISDALQ